MYAFDEPEAAVPYCDQCKDTTGVALCHLDGIDVDLCGECRDEVFCPVCGLHRADCDCPDVLADTQRGAA